MDVAVIQVWQAHGDGGERGKGPVIGYYSTELRAKTAAHRKGWYGGDGHVEPAPAIKIDGKVYVLVSHKPVDLDGLDAAVDAKLREQTLAGLSAEQIRVLGIKA